MLQGTLRDNFLASFALGWGTSTFSSLASYPFDTIRRRMMMTSGGTGPHYKNMFDAGRQIVAKEGAKALFKGAGANVIRSIAGGVSEKKVQSGPPRRQATVRRPSPR